MGRSSTLEESVRWARCLAEIVKQAAHLCSESAQAVYVEVSSRLQVCLPRLLGNTPQWAFACTGNTYQHPTYLNETCGGCISTPVSSPYYQLHTHELLQTQLHGGHRQLYVLVPVGNDVQDQQPPGDSTQRHFRGNYKGRSVPHILHGGCCLPPVHSHCQPSPGGPPYQGAL